MFEDFDEDFCQCPRCSGWGEIDCHCGGDLCVCENYGSAPCPLCYGEGVVSEVLHDQYLDHQREPALCRGARQDRSRERTVQLTRKEGP